jgi:mRNA interferase MazF
VGCFAMPRIKVLPNLHMGTFDKRFLPAMDKALAISIGLNGYSQCTMKQDSLPAHECCPPHDDSV